MAVEIYSKDSCMFCQKAKSLFNQHDIAFEEHDVSTVDRFNKMIERIPNARTVPQIIIDGHVIGGWDMLDAHKEPILKKLKATHS
ncbi:glutaredoxin domain-containing protein [Terasakiella sp. A23]|uniref:glutaredoxin family protein n=1 Tax=Terasakiella sp. FCG-A23 TaxID=3080561 RepID=UPI002955174F|nr:glutaredoxin domain-containing protein [Terasakiella sp. A23]MDV7338328.1 glutaredoxin domain-containing protein [Terasakiella sp. A23]